MTEFVSDEMLLHVHRVTRGPAVVVQAAGEVDMDSIEALHTELVAALASVVPPAPVVVDLREIRFLGSAGLNELLTQHQSADEQLTPLRIVATQRSVLRPIETSGLTPVFAVFPDLDRALSAAPR